MFFAASARLAELTAELGNLAAGLDTYLADADGSWMLSPGDIASALDVSPAQVDYLLDKAVQAALLRVELYFKCDECGFLISEAERAEAEEYDESMRCSRCGTALPSNAVALPVYRLSAEAEAEAEERQKLPTLRAVIITALEVELKAVLAHLGAHAQETHERGTVYYTGQFLGRTARWDIACVWAGAGNDGAAVETERAIDYWQPKIALFVGVAGGIKDVALGDVVAADVVFNYQSGKALNNFQPRPKVGDSAYALVQAAKAAIIRAAWQSRVAPAEGRKPKAIVGPIAAGEQVVASIDSDTYKLIRAEYDTTVAAEMEGAGFLRAAYQNQQVEALVVRGISDLIGDKGEADAAGWQPVAASHAAAFAFDVLASVYPTLSAMK